MGCWWLGLSIPWLVHSLPSDLTGAGMRVWPLPIHTAHQSSPILLGWTELTTQKNKIFEGCDHFKRKMHWVTDPNKSKILEQMDLVFKFALF